MNLRKTDHSGLNLFLVLSFLIVCFIGGYFLWTTKDVLPLEADNTDFLYAPSRANELTQELDSIYSCKSGPRMEKFLDTWHRKYTSNASTLGKQNDTLRNVYNLFTTLFNPDPTLRPRGYRSDSAYRYVVIQSQLMFCVAEDSMFDYYYESSPPPKFPTDGFYLLREAGAYYKILTDFRPQIRQAGLKRLYLTDEYKDALELFLGKNGYWPDEDQTSAESGRKRMRFLQNYWYIINGHWEGWNLGIPQIGYIVLNKSLDKAVVEVLGEYNGNGVLLHKTHSGWKEVKGLYHWEE
ncbi:hypothetical protein KG007_10415 [Alistipes sp. kh20]|uniref:hypothetical protein n=1 Tax=Alistipes montrealensis TaxID=2834113 RepID=UPI001BCD33D8|nr:hypothetical protein [Alistipes montrealensis]MBS4766616.1 hypothetical protein [Alistipes montrealensis]